MKKLYNTPEVEMLRFAPVEQIASATEYNNPLTSPEKPFSDPNAIVVDISKILGL